MSDEEPRRPGHSGRPHVVPPALLGSGEPFDGHRILDEVRSPLGVVLWQTARDVVAWAVTPKKLRSYLFSPGSFEIRLEHLAYVKPGEDLQGPIASIAKLFASAQADPHEMAKACRKISQWAEAQGLPGTAIWYAQATVMCVPDNAEYAYTVGLLCRRNAEYVRAETWFRRAIGLARRRRDARTYALSYMGLGNLYIKRLDHARAKDAFERALRTARRAGIRTVRAEALHDLFVVAVETGRVEEAEALARRAYKAYPASHSRLPALAHDVAVFWMLQGFHERALPAFQAVAPILTRPSDRLLTLSTIARAAGGAGRKDIFLSTWIETWQLIDARPTLECVTSSLLRLAYGSAYLDDWERVDLAARLAYDLATERGEEDVLREAKGLLDARETQQFVETLIPPPTEPEIAEAADTLADDLVRSLTGYAGRADYPRIQC